MSGLCDKALKSQYAVNKYRFNGGNELQNQEFSDGSGLEAYDATFRMYDPQLGRFWQIDPLADINENSSPYSFVFNNPIKYNDPSGLDTNWKALPTATVTYTYKALPSSNVNVDLADVETYKPIEHAVFLWRIDHTIASEPTWWQSLTHGSMYEGKNLLGNDMYLDYYGGIAPSASFSRFNPRDILKLYKIIKNLQWSSRTVAQAAKLLLRGAKEVTVENKEEAEELYLAIFQEKGYTNTTEMSTKDMKDKFLFPEGKKGTYHWDLNDTQHGGVSHLQVHDGDGNVIRIFFGQ